MMSSDSNALTRETLMREMDASWNALQRSIASLTEAQLIQPTDAAGWTVKDHIIHLALWEEAGLALFEGKSKRETLDIPQDVWDEGEDPFSRSALVTCRLSR
jgi:hypothetical protein